MEKLGPIRKHAEKIGNQLIDAFVLAALFVLGGTIVWSAVYAYLGMMDQAYGSISCCCSSTWNSAPWSASISRAAGFPSSS